MDKPLFPDDGPVTATTRRSGRVFEWFDPARETDQHLASSDQEDGGRWDDGG